MGGLTRVVEAEFIGKRVQWTGSVAAVSKNLTGKPYVTFRHKRESGSDVTVYFSEKHKAELLELDEGDLVTYQGFTSSRGGWLLNHELKGGKIIKVKR